MKELFDESIQYERFNIAPVTAGVFDNTKYTTYKTQLEEHFTPKQTKKIPRRENTRFALENGQ